MKKLFSFLLTLILTASAFAGCMPEEESTDISAEDSAQVSAEVSDEASEAVSDEVSEEVSEEAEIDEAAIKKAIVGNWETKYNLEEHKDGSLWVTWYTFAENGIYSSSSAHHMVFEDENGELVMEPTDGTNGGGTYTIEGDTITMVTEFNPEHGPGGYARTYKITIDGDILMLGDEEYVKTGNDTSWLPEKTVCELVYGLWANNEPDGDAYNRQWWKIEENGNCEHGTGRFIKAASNDTDTVVINGENYIMENGEVIKGTFTVFGGCYGEFKFTANGEEHVYYVEVHNDSLSMLSEYEYASYDWKFFKKQ